MSYASSVEAFAQLYTRLDRTTRLSQKAAALRAYFETADPRDAAWALSVLTGRRLIRAVSSKRLRKWVGEVADLPDWLVNESYDAVGDLSEALALLLPPPTQRGPAGLQPRLQEGPTGLNPRLQGRAAGLQPRLHRVIQEWILPLEHMDEAGQRASLLETWDRLDAGERFVFHKLISGSFRVGVSKKGVINAFAAAAGVEPAVMQHRLLSKWEPTPEAYARLLSGAGGDDPGRPYPFYLADQLDAPPAEALGDRDLWQAEWKWDGIRAQLIHREGLAMVWSRGEELITGGFPELADVARELPSGTVLDGEVLAWEGAREGIGSRDEPGGHPLPFAMLQKRLNRKGVERMLFVDVPVVFMAYDLIEQDGRDLREMPTTQRRERLDAVVQEAAPRCDGHLLLSPLIDAPTWASLGLIRGESRARGVEGVMLKRRDTPYRAGRVKGDWWKWKVDPHSVDCVMIYAQRGNGKRASLFSDYTFGVWTGDTPGEGELVPVAKAYTGLTDEELGKVDAWIKRHTLGRKGPVRMVQPVQVFELAFEAIQESDRHRSGVALRFPRMARWRTDKRADEADTLAHLRRLIRVPGQGEARSSTAAAPKES